MLTIQSNNLQELRKIKGLIIDMDGVLWQGDTPMPGLSGFFDVLRERQIKSSARKKCAMAVVNSLARSR